ncbi:MAG: response regulator [Desulfobacterales bacterium]|nr:response regulator [Desulfobacterales bacterium]
MSQIMVLDDVEDAGAMIKRILERKGHSVAVFTEEHQALEYAKQQHVDIAILDIKLKKMSGVAVLKQLKEAGPDIEVLMLTGYPTLETAREAMDFGAREYLVKPIDKNELEQKVQSLLENRSSA